MFDYGTGSGGSNTVGLSYRAPYSPMGMVIPVSTPMYNQWLVVRVADVEHFKQTKKVRVIWFGESSARVDNSDFRKGIIPLLVAVFEHFGKDTGKPIQEDFQIDDERLKALEGK